MKLSIYYIDAFTNSLFSGNPAAVIFSNLDNSKVMQNIAAENNLSETAFISYRDNKYFIRWFAPECEIDLCGHATLASAHVFFNYINNDTDIFEVHSKRNGVLKVFKNEDALYLDFPRDQLFPSTQHNEVFNSVGISPIDLYEGRDDLLAIFENKSDIENLNLNVEAIKNIDKRGLIVTAPGDDCDFVSRCFFPSTGVIEDPVTGSAHTSLIPYWSKKLNKNKLIAKQLSQRGGVLFCEHKNDRVHIGGNSVLYLKGEIFI
ncbi:PhzF family phenazine biosynthesis protein [Gammaproteobacteria bacterium]|nr:PhzF family phenazine biosynthesis protein [Gammaproteobacteria bacterium]MDA9124135.1 PhzF family phenazine biosynthesis protein [Gammaproteobacteria bacterium]MDA9932609.1 PhzF family phenazine biosynthesis protein [Gammaproteobacteria bacterium]MDC0439888.1 PhzF family phenazine biosynthesis protein [Gammaproteobacteria bacterium]